MTAIVLVIHVILACALVGVILIQRSEGGALSGLGGGNFGGIMSGRGTANLLTRTTAILAGCFIVTSLVLAILSGNRPVGTSILDRPATTAPQAPVDGTAPTPPAPAPEPAAPAQPSAPIAQ